MAPPQAPVRPLGVGAVTQPSEAPGMSGLEAASSLSLSAPAAGGRPLHQPLRYHVEGAGATITVVLRLRRMACQ